MIVIGIDPGKSGGLAAIRDGLVVDAMSMPVEPRGKGKAKEAVSASDIRGFIWEADEEVVAVLEQVHAMPRQGVSSSFQFGRMYGGVEVAAHAYADRVEYVTPHEWKKALLPKGAPKDASRELASSLYPGGSIFWPLKKHEGVAEAALIAHYWMEKHDIR